MTMKSTLKYSLIDHLDPKGSESFLGGSNSRAAKKPYPWLKDITVEHAIESFPGNREKKKPKRGGRKRAE